MTGSTIRTCFYCGTIFSVSRSAVGDHMPMPKRHGGDETVPCCWPCHQMKDLIPASEWPEEWIEKVLADFPKMSRETKLWLAKVISIYTDALAVIGDADAKTEGESQRETGGPQ